MAALDLTGRRFGRLKVIEPTDIRSDRYVVWRCRCDCGNTAFVSTRDLLRRGTVSCGCNRKEKAKDNLAGDIKQKLGQVEHTNVSRIAATKAQRNNKSGYRGVSWHPFPHGNGKWVAVIYFKKKRYRLGFYDTPEDAHKAYVEGKEHIHGQFLEWYKNRKGDVES